MAKLTLNRLTNLNNTTTTLSKLNENAALLEAAIENTVSRDGSTPNQLDTPLDMNGNLIFNTQGTASIQSTPDLTIADFGEVGGANASPALQAMINSVGGFKIPIGTFNFQDPITLASYSSPTFKYGYKGIGMGEGVSILNASSMAGASLFNYNTNDQLRLYMGDFSVTGDADSAFLKGPSSGSMYWCAFERIFFTSVAGPSVSLFDGVQDIFSLQFNDCRFSSVNGHGIDILGNIDTVFNRCEGIKCGNDKALFRIRGGARLNDCNGGYPTAPNAQRWGDFGMSGTSPYYIIMDGCNIEDFDGWGISLRYAGKLILRGGNMQARDSGTFETYIKALDGTQHWIEAKDGFRAFSKGATMTGAAKIIAPYAQVTSDYDPFTGSSTLTTYRSTSAATTYNIPYKNIVNVDTTDYAMQYSRTHSLRESGFIAPVPLLLTVNSTAPAITVNNFAYTQNTVATNLNQITGGTQGQKLTLYIEDANTTIKNNIGGAGRFLTRSGADIAASANKVYEFIYWNSIWRQTQ